MEEVFVSKVANCLGIKLKPSLDKLKKSLLDNEDCRQAISHFINE
jgi:hypothetical protein